MNVQLNKNLIKYFIYDYFYLNLNLSKGVKIISPSR